MSESPTAPVSASNAQPYTVSELAFALKRTIEDAYGFVRLRGELSKVTFHGNGHVYLDLKDERASISGVIWKTSVPRLGIRPQTGLEVIVTGKITTYPGRSQYQIIIETMEPAGMGALLAQLERLKAKLAAEGLFEPGRKQRLPAMPAVVGVITSPTGAVIRDIMHRIRERWPCRVVVWPVVVQGDQAAAQVRAAIEGFAALAPGGPIPRPDLLIVARGGGSVEDLWPFNDEALARAVAACPIPLISAVGHETDTTLIDFVSDRRAPTPTAAAEIATPVFADLRAGLADQERRLVQGGARILDIRRTRLSAAARGLPRPQDILLLASQRFDHAAARLGSGLEKNLAVHRQQFVQAGANLRPALLRRPVEEKGRRLEEVFAKARPSLTRQLDRAAERLVALESRLGSEQDRNLAARRQQFAHISATLRPALLQRPIELKAQRLAALEKLRLSLDPDGPLMRGFARIHHASGRLVRNAGAVAAGEAVKLVFVDGERGAVIDGPAPRATRAKARPAAPAQGDLF